MATVPRPPTVEEEMDALARAYDTQQPPEVVPELLPEQPKICAAIDCDAKIIGCSESSYSVAAQLKGFDPTAEGWRQDASVNLCMPMNATTRQIARPGMQVKLQIRVVFE